MPNQTLDLSVIQQESKLDTGKQNQMLLINMFALLISLKGVFLPQHYCVTTVTLLLQEQ